MFAIKITEENMEKIKEAMPMLHGPYLRAIEAKYMDRRVPWYFIRGYVDQRGRLHLFNLLPVFILDQHFEIDTEKAKTDWDQIVRKETPE